MNERQKEIAFENIFKDIKKLVSSVCWDHYHFGHPPECPECEDCEGRRLMEIQDDDYKIIRLFEGNRSRVGTEIFENLFEIEGQIQVRGRNKSKFSTYLISVLKKKIIDKDIRKEKGQYRPYKEIKKLGECAEKLGKFIWEGMNLNDAHEKIKTIDECRNTTIEEAQEVESIIIKKKKINKNIDIDFKSDLEEHLKIKEENIKSRSALIGENENYSDDPESNLEENQEQEEKAKLVDKLNKVLADYKVNLTEQDKLILNMNYYKEINASQIAKAIDQNRYYVEKRIKEMLDDLRNLMI